MKFKRTPSRRDIANKKPIARTTEQWQRETTSLYLVVTMIRDAVNRYRDSKLQRDEDELNRLTGLFNLPPDRLIEACERECAEHRKP